MPQEVEITNVKIKFWTLTGLCFKYIPAVLIAGLFWWMIFMSLAGLLGLAMFSGF